MRIYPLLKPVLLLVALGAGLPACYKTSYCGGGHRYIDIEGVSVQAYRGQNQPLTAGQSVVPPDLKLEIKSQERRYGATRLPCPGGSVALADCDLPEYPEKVDSLIVTSRYEYDARHPAGASLNDVLLTRVGTTIGTELAQHPASFAYGLGEGLILLIGQPPARSGPQQFRVRCRLSNGEVHTAETPLLTLTI